jgi:HEPN domain-containing protein
MRPERFPPDDPHEWLQRAHSNLIQARVEREGVYLEDLCFQAQQATAKALKALLIQHGVRFPRTHSLAVLVSLLEQTGERVPEYVRDATRLTDYAIEARYPGLDEMVDREEYLEAVALAEAVIHWVEDSIP